MKYGLTVEQYELLNKLCLTPLKLINTKVWIFGSRARGDYKKFSDIDLLFDNSKVPKAVIGKIIEDLENSNLPYKVDLVAESDLAESYRDQVHKDKILID
jgi:predicted nucleotidyltransferase